MSRRASSTSFVEEAIPVSDLHSSLVSDNQAARPRMMDAKEFRWSVVVPVYGNRDSLAALIVRLIELARVRDGRLEAVFVVDGSPDDSLEVLRRGLADGLLESQVLSLSRNFGSFSAIRAGLAVARGDFIAVMAADLQEPVEVVASFFDALAADECDIAVGERIGRDDPAASAFFSRIYWRFYQRFINPDIPTGGIDVFGCTRAIAARIVAFPETHTSLIGLLYWMGFRRRTFPYDRQPRHSGVSGWTFRRKLRYLFDTIYAFSDLPIILLQLLGLVGVILSVLIGVVVLIGFIVGAIHQPGYTPLMIVIAGSTSAILLATGVVGSYVWRAYENGKNRPLGLVATHEFFEVGAHE